MKVYGLCREFSPQYYVDGYLTYPSQMKDYLEGLDTKPWTIIRLDIGQHEFDKLQDDNKRLRKQLKKLEEQIEFLKEKK
jgi:hypothetical protein